jgi:hypothetical protein
MKLVKVKEGLQWRYQLYVRPYILLNESPVKALLRKYNNYLLRHSSKPFCYIYADATNIGDKVSFLGVKFLTGKKGIELFSSTAGLKTTVSQLKWLEKKRPQARIIIGGGGLLQECFVPFWTQLLKTSLSFTLFGIGANEIPGKRKIPPDDLLKQIAHRAISINVRDEWSRKLLDHGQETKISIGVCPSINYLTYKFPKQAYANEKYLLHIQHPVDVRMAGGDAERISSIVKLVAANLKLQYIETNHINQNLDLLAKFYKGARFVVSSRLHGCIFSYAFRKPFVAIVCDKKTDEFINTHIPNNPTASVNLTLNEITQKLIRAETLNNTSTDCGIQTKILNNVHAMNNVIQLYK